MKKKLNNYAEKMKIICIIFAYMRKIVYICIEIQGRLGGSGRWILTGILLNGLVIFVFYF